MKSTFKLPMTLDGRLRGEWRTRKFDYTLNPRSEKYIVNEHYVFKMNVSNNGCGGRIIVTRCFNALAKNLI
jgi:hypothetical protein